MAKIYLYHNSAKQLIAYNDVTVIDTVAISVLESVHKEDIDKGFGKIIIDEKDGYKPKYVESNVFIMIDKKTNDFSRVDFKGTDDENFYYTEVSNKDFVYYYYQDRSLKVVKYFENAFHIFDNDATKDYNPVTNTMDLNLEKYKNKIIHLIANSEDDIKHHGFYHDIFGKEYCQPFRNTPENDLLIISTMITNAPLEMRALKLFKEDPTTKKRLTATGTCDWLVQQQVTDEILKVIAQFITIYSSYVKVGMEQLILNVQNETALPKLQYIEANYIVIILRNLKKQIEEVATVAKVINDIKAFIKAKNLVPSDENGISKIMAKKAPQPPKED